MAQEILNFGAYPNDPTADAIRDSFQKIQNNFTELYSQQLVGAVTSINAGSGISVNRTTGAVVVSANLNNLTVQTGNNIRVGIGVASGRVATVTSSNTPLTIDLADTITVSNVLATTLSGTLTTNAQPNITSLGTVTGITSTGNITAPWFIGNVQGSFTGTVAAPGSNNNIIFNRAGSFNASNNLTWDDANFRVVGNGFFNNINASGNINGARITGSLTTNAQPNITSVGSLSNLQVSGDTVTSNLIANGNITASYVLGNGAFLTGILATDANSANTIRGGISGGILYQSALNTTGFTSAGNTGQILTSTGGGAPLWKNPSELVTVANLIPGTYLTSNSNQNYNGTSATIFNVTATTAAEAGKLVARDANGNIYANSVIANSIVGTAGAPGSDTNVIFNDNGQYGFRPGFTYTPGNSTLSAPFFAGDGSKLTNLNVSGLVSSVGNANYANFAGTVVTASQPNITSVGTLTSLNVNGIITAGQVRYTSTDGSSGQVLSTYGNGTTYWRSVSSAGLTNGSSNIAIATAGGPVTISATGVDNVVSVTSSGVTFKGVLTGNGAGLTNIPASSITGSFTATTAQTAGTVTQNAQPNITSVGTLTSLNVSGVISGSGAGLTNIPASAISGSLPTPASAITAGTVTQAAQPNITSVGTLTSLNVSGVISGNGAGLTNIPISAITGSFPVPPAVTTVSQAAQPNITSVGALTGLTMASGGGIALSGPTSSITGANSISAGFFSGNGYNLASINAANIVGTLPVGSISGSFFIGTTSISLGRSSAPQALTGISDLPLTKFNERVITQSVSGLVTPDCAQGTIFVYTLTGSLTLSSLLNAVSGTSVTIVLKQDGTGNRTLSSSFKFAGGIKTLSTAANATDIMFVFFDGLTYYASLAKGFV